MFKPATGLLFEKLILLMMIHVRMRVIPVHVFESVSLTIREAVRGVGEADWVSIEPAWRRGVGQAV
jgi:hypothetical protein